MKLAQSLVFAVSLLATGAAFSQNYPVGDYPPQAQATSSLSRASVSADAARWNQAGRPGLVPGEGRPSLTYAVSAGEPASRAAVSNDARQWLRSGMADLNRGEATPDFGSTAWRTALGRYQHDNQTGSIGAAAVGAFVTGANTVDAPVQRFN